MVDHQKATRTRRIVEEFVLCLFRGEKTMPILYYIPPSPPSRMVLLLGRLLNIEFDLRLIDLMKGEHLKPEFIEVRDDGRQYFFFKLLHIFNSLRFLWRFSFVH